MSAHWGKDKLVFTTLSVFSCLIFSSYAFLLPAYLSIFPPTQRQSFTLSLELALQCIFSSSYSPFYSIRSFSFAFSRSLCSSVHLLKLSFESPRLWLLPDMSKSSPSIATADMSKCTHPNPGACCVYLLVGWIGEGEGGCVLGESEGVYTASSTHSYVAHCFTQPQRAH